ncbi:MAG TPA: hypothetical protein VE077_15855, partial [Candidatus Methylomirabilis sp.]|nr:hypothetical protein [Candidatus Methylomirabilis sp.]
MATQTTDIPFSSTTTKARAGADNIEAEAIGLEVPVRINGTQLTSVMGTTEHAEPFEEDTATMIVFPRGAVVKLLARVRTGQTVALTNLRTHSKVTCKIFQVNTANKDVHYVKLEFAQAAQGFWGMHFPSEPLPVMRKPEPASQAAPNYSTSTSFVDPVSVPPAEPVPAQSQSRDIFSHVAVPQRPIAPLLNENPAPASPSAYTSPLAPPDAPRKDADHSEMTIPASISPATPFRETAKIQMPSEPPKFELPEEAPADKKNSGYGLARNWQKEQIEPLAGSATSSAVETAVAALVETPAPAPVAEKIPMPGRRPQSVPPASSKREKTRQKPVRPVFGELHSFNASPSGSAAPALRDANFAMSSVAQSSSVSPRSRSKLFPVLAAVCVLAVIAAGVMYVKRHPSLFASSSAVSQPAVTTQTAPDLSQTQTANQPQVTTPPQISAPAASSPAAESTTPISPATTPPGDSTLNARSIAPRSKKPVVEKASEKSSKAPAERNAAAKNDAANSDQSTATVIPNLYAGDLNARPEIKQHAVKQLDAQAPDITVTAPGGDPVSGETASLSSIVPGADSGTTSLATPAPEIRQGGSVQEPKLISSVPPVYPALAQQNRVEGDVTIQAMIGISGNVSSMKVI